ncbi:co-chaperone DjlA [Nitrincola tapanii]|uniref:Co-chaperone protein DjlA n=1 Tax=Nitrincola tapanii TaxID=1708751 RepID=A0A5A9VZY4_9GAMM|nr:co-chaperone DjlA [Nitrincola tapanii]KAA0874036.1 co-chaperone DjlA [Nitrincola tapanii]
MNHEAWGQTLGQRVKVGKTGILLGAFIGLFSGGWVGLILGGLTGYFIERFLRKATRLAPQQLFFRATFCVMGKIAKADGRVTETEIEFAREVMARMNLNEAAKRRAIEYFNEGKQADFDLAKVLRPLELVLRTRFPLRVMFLELQLQVALADGEMSAAELKIIEEICHLLRFSPLEMQQVAARIRAAHAYAQHHYEWHQQAGAAFDERPLLQDAYGILGVNEQASEAEVKKAWRRLMSQHHPDKLVAKGLPQEMLELAKEKTQEIQSAYERIRKARGWR